MNVTYYHNSFIDNITYFHGNGYNTNINILNSSEPLK